MRPRRGLAGFAAVALLALGASMSAAEDPDTDAPCALALSGAVGAHDPTIVLCEGKYYRFRSGFDIPMAVSKDLRAWASIGTAFDRGPAWTRADVPESTDYWAPEVVRLGGRYRMYYSVSSFGSNRSAIGLASNSTLDPSSPDYAWVDEGKVIESKPSDPYNCIDPCVAFDAEGVPWMGFGSFWSGIKLVKLDKGTGKLADPTAAPLSIARRPDSVDAIEGSFILPKDGKYFLFVSFDFCCRGSRSDYNIRVGRSDSIAGPYLDREGKAMVEGGGSLLRESGERYKGPGHNSVLVVGADYYLVYHAYDARHGGLARCRIEPLKWDEEGWPYVTGRGAGKR
jgi:arabinan endo-1,5-alpha-L-arabinosidase